MIFDISSILGPECLPCETTDKNFIDGDNIGSTDTRGALIGGFDICDDGQVKDPRGVCKTAHTFSPSKEKKDVEPREITSPKPKINLREYLQSDLREITSPKINLRKRKLQTFI